MFSSRRVRIGISLLAAALGMGLLAWSFWPAPRQSVQAACRQCDLGQAYTFTLETPAWIRLGEPAEVRLTLAPSGGGAPAAWPQGRGYQLDASLFVSGSHLDPEGDVLAGMAPGKPVRLSWRVTPVTPGVLEGTLWVYLDGTDAGGAAEGQALAAFPIQVRAVGLGGFGAGGARVLGAAVALLGVILALPGWDAVGRPRPSKRGKRGSP